MHTINTYRQHNPGKSSVLHHKISIIIKTSGVIAAVRFLFSRYLLPRIIRRHDTFILHRSERERIPGSRSVTVSRYNHVSPPGESLLTHLDKTITYSNSAELVRNLDSGATLWVCSTGSSVCGYCLSTRRALPGNTSVNDAVYIFDVEILPQLRGKGIGSAFLSTISSIIFEAQEVSDIWCRIHACNKASQALFMRNGFTLQKTP